MPVRHDEMGKAWVEVAAVLPAPPDAVWHAMATGPGNAAWFTAGRIEERVGGKFELDFGNGAVSGGVVTAWEPPHRFGYVEIGWEEGAPPCNTEIAIAARPDGRSVVRMTHAMQGPSADVDSSLEQFEAGWPAFFEVLRLYLTHHAGAEAASCMAVQHASGEPLALWRRLLDATGLAGAQVGERVTAPAGAPEAIAGVVENLVQVPDQRHAIVRLDGDAPGVLLASVYRKAGQAPNVTICRFAYGPGAAARLATAEPAWRTWLASTFGAVAAE